MPVSEINRPDVVAEVRAAFDRYERALLANDVAALDDFFRDADDTVRYGLADHQYGAPAIRRWRAQATGVDPRRRLAHTVIVTFGRDFASVSTEFSLPDPATLGRQSQTWVRLPSGWKIVAAHVSEIDAGRLRRF